MDRRKTLPKGIRWFLLILQHLLVVVTAVCAVIVLSNSVVLDLRDTGTRGYYFDLFESEKQFKDTEVFYDMFHDQVDDLLPEVVISSQFGDNGTIDADHVINISDYANRKNSDYTGRENSVEYRLADLLKWYNSGYTYEYRFDGVEVQILKESYLPIDGISLLDRAASQQEYELFVKHLKQSISDLGINWQRYQSNAELFSAGNSNLRYYFVLKGEDGEEKAYTNFVYLHENMEHQFLEMDAYVIYHVESLDYMSNIPGAYQTDLQAQLDEYNYVFDNATEVYIGVDIEYGADDIFAKAYDAYQTVTHVWYYIATLAAAAFFWLMLLIYLSVMAGRKRKNGVVEIEETWVDWIPTEVFFALFGGLLFGVLYGCVYILDRSRHYFWDAEGDFLRNGVIAVSFVVSILFSTMWYSVIRRLKLHTFLKNSLIGMAIAVIWKVMKRIFLFFKNFILKCYNNWGIVARVVVPLAALLLFNIIMGGSGFYLIFSWSVYASEVLMGLFVLFLVLVVDIVFAYFMIKANLSRREIVEGIIRISNGEMDYQVSTEGMHGENLEIASAVNCIGKGIKKAVETSMKDEKMKADLITNVSHDIKTPLTSIINYVDLLKRENIETEPVKGYIEVLDTKSQRLKQLTDDLVEASKISSGNIVFDMQNIDFAELLKQSIGEFAEKLEEKNLTLIENYPEEPMYINVDPARIWRVVENLFNNVLKYALEGTRVYLDLERRDASNDKVITVSIKNISKNPLNISPEELTERFIRGDESRTTEGSGLGLSIAKSLTEAMGGKFEILFDGDLFKVLLHFPEVK